MYDKEINILKELKEYPEDLPGYFYDEVIDAIEIAIKVLEQAPILEKDGTLVITTNQYEKVTRVLVQHGINGTLFYQDNE